MNDHFSGNHRLQTIAMFDVAYDSAAIIVSASDQAGLPSWIVSRQPEDRIPCDESISNVPLFVLFIVCVCVAISYVVVVMEETRC